MCVCVCVCVRVCSCVRYACVRACWGQGKGGIPEPHRWVGNNIIRSSSFFNIAVSHTANTHHFTVQVNIQC